QLFPALMQQWFDLKRNYNLPAAPTIKSATFRGWDTMGTWLDASSSVVALIGLALNRSRSGLIIPSFAATIYQEGFVFHAGLYTFSSVADAAHATCVAWISFLSSGDTSCAKNSLIPFGDSDKKPSVLSLNSGPTAVGGIAAFTSLTFCPSSGTSAAT